MQLKRKSYSVCKVQVKQILSKYTCIAWHLNVQFTGQSLQELGKEKTSQKAVENNTQQFLKSLKIIETKLSEQISYLTQVSTGQPHEGSGYASAKVLQMAWHRIQHARSRVREMEDSKNKYKQLVERQQQKHTTLTSTPPAAPSPSAGQPISSAGPTTPTSVPPATSSS